MPACQSTDDMSTRKGREGKKLSLAYECALHGRLNRGIQVWAPGKQQKDCQSRKQQLKKKKSGCGVSSAQAERNQPSRLSLVPLRILHGNNSFLEIPSKNWKIYKTKLAQQAANGPAWMPHALKSLCLVHFWSWMNSLFSLLAFWGSKNWPPV